MTSEEAASTEQITPFFLYYAPLLPMDREMGGKANPIPSLGERNRKRKADFQDFVGR